MIKQIQWLENQVIPQQVTAPEQEVKQPPVPKSENQTIIQQVPVSTPLVKPPASVYSSGNVVESVGAFPNELYERLGLSIPRWLLWVLTFVLGITVSGLLASSLALWTPLWSNLDQTKDDEFGSYKQDQVKIPAGLWTQLSQYKLSRPMNILIMGIEPVAGTVDGSPENFAGKSDTMMLVRLNPSDKSIRVLSIPRGTMIAIPE
ncbi:MAG: LCP family protein, partial [Dolichospermum sp.]